MEGKKNKRKKGNVKRELLDSNDVSPVEEDIYSVISDEIYKHRCPYSEEDLLADPSLYQKVIDSTIRQSDLVVKLKLPKSKRSKVQYHVRRLIESERVTAFRFKADGMTPLRLDSKKSKNTMVRLCVYRPGTSMGKDILDAEGGRVICTSHLDMKWRVAKGSLANWASGVTLHFPNSSSEFVSIHLGEEVLNDGAGSTTMCIGQETLPNLLMRSDLFMLAPRDLNSIGKKVTFLSLPRADLYPGRWHYKGSPPIAFGISLGHVALCWYPRFNKVAVTNMGPENTVAVAGLGKPNLEQYLDLQPWARFGTLWPHAPKPTVRGFERFPSAPKEIEQRMKFAVGTKDSIAGELKNRPFPPLLTATGWLGIFQKGKSLYGRNIEPAPWVDHLISNTVVAEMPFLLRVGGWHTLVNYVEPKT